jgi:hypothetical protein
MEILFYYPNSPYFKSPPIRKLTSFPINPSPSLTSHHSLPTTQFLAFLPNTLMSSNSSHHSHVVKLFPPLNFSPFFPPLSCRQTLLITQLLATTLMSSNSSHHSTPCHHSHVIKLFPPLNFSPLSCQHSFVT